MTNPVSPFKSADVWEKYGETHPRPISNKLYEQLFNLDELKISEPVKILLLGVGNGEYDLKPLLDYVTKMDQSTEITAVDWSLEALDKAKLNLNGYTYPINYVCEDAEEFIEVTSDKYNVIIALMTLHHFTNWRMFLYKLPRVSNNGIFVYDEYSQPGFLAYIDANFKSNGSKCPELSKYFKQFFSALENKLGIFWGPEIRGTNYSRFEKHLKHIGFKEIQTIVSDRINSRKFPAQRIRQSLLGEVNTYSQLWWGNGKRHRAFCTDYIEKNPLPECAEEYSFETKYNLYKIPAEIDPIKICDTYWLNGYHASLFHSRLILELDKLKEPKSDEYNEYLQIKLLQYLIFSGCLSWRTLFFAPVVLKLDKLEDWTTITSERTFILRNESSVKANSLNDHLAIMKYFADAKYDSITNELMESLKLPISFTFAVSADINHIRIDSHEFHTGTLLNVLIPAEVITAIDWHGIFGKSDNSDDYFQFLRFKAGYHQASSVADNVKLKQNIDAISTYLTDCYYEFTYAISDKDMDRIISFFKSTIPKISYLLTVSRVTIVGLYQVKISEDDYSGLGSIFIADQLNNSDLSQSNIHRFEFIQFLAQKFSALYFVESIKDLLTSERELKDFLSHFTEIASRMGKLQSNVVTKLTQMGNNLTSDMAMLYNEFNNDNSEIRKELIKIWNIQKLEDNRGIYHCNGDRATDDIKMKMIAKFHQWWEDTAKQQIPLLVEDPVFYTLFEKNIVNVFNIKELVETNLRLLFSYFDNKFIVELDAWKADKGSFDFLINSKFTSISPYHIQHVCEALIKDGFAITKVTIDERTANIEYNKTDISVDTVMTLLLGMYDSIKAKRESLGPDRWSRFKYWPFAFAKYYLADVELHYSNQYIKIHANTPPKLVNTDYVASDYKIIVTGKEGKYI